MDEGQREQGGQGYSDATPALEWISAAIGFALTLGMLIFIGWQAFDPARGDPPALRVRAERIAPNGEGWLVEVVVENLSPGTAAGVQIEGELKDGERTIAVSQATLDYVPGHSARRAGLVFGQDPHVYGLTVRALGYAKP